MWVCACFVVCLVCRVCVLGASGFSLHKDYRHVCDRIVSPFDLFTSQTVME